MDDRDGELVIDFGSFDFGEKVAGFDVGAPARESPERPPVAIISWAGSAAAGLAYSARRRAPKASAGPSACPSGHPLSVSSLIPRLWKEPGFANIFARPAGAGGRAGGIFQHGATFPWGGSLIFRAFPATLRA